MFSATDAAFAGFRLAGRHPFLMVFWAFASAIAVLVLVLTVLTAVAPSAIMAIATGGGAPTFPPPDPPVNVLGLALAFPLIFAAVLLFTAVTITAVYRAVLRPSERGLGYIRIGGDEGRQILLMLLIFVVAISAMLAALVALALATALTPDPWKALALFAGGVVCALLFVWVNVRLSLAAAQTFAERRVDLFGSWALTRGRFWPLLGMWLLSFVLALVVSMVFSAISYLPLVVTPGGLEALAARFAREPSAEHFKTVYLVTSGLQAVIQLIGMVVQSVVSTVPGAAAYAQLKRPA
ncbi:MAG: hypothetical protein ACOY4K_14145 [Pseudomonadota bacterium]